MPEPSTQLFVRAARITLPSPIGAPLSGWAMPDRIARGAADPPLEANLLVLADMSGPRVSLVTVDALFAGPKLVEAVRRAVAPLPAFVLASHTHSAPQTDAGKPRLGAYATEWTEAAGEACARTVKRLLDAPDVEAEIAVAAGPVGRSVHRRRWIGRPHFVGRRLTGPGMVMAPSRWEFTADVARVAVLRRRGGEAVAVLWTWPCHPTSEIEPGLASADYVGVVRDGLRRALGAGVPVLHLQGFCGDVRPPSGRPTAKGMLRRLLFGPSFHRMSPDALAQWRRSIADRIVALARSAEPTGSPTTLAIGRTQLLLSQLLTSCDDWSIEMAAVALSDDLKLIMLAAEPSAGHVHIVERVFPGAWPIGYLGDVFGYLPTSAQVPEGGYEVNGYMALFGIPAGATYCGDPDSRLGEALATLRNALVENAASATPRTSRS